jgi:predicted GNAT superfamily acetyltransferase
MIVIRNCSGFEELEAVVQLQIDTWGYDHSDIVPRKAFLVMQKVGGQVMGAFDTDLPGALAEGDAKSMVGFVMSLPGVKTGTGCGDKPRAYLHSHMLAVREPYRNTGLGTQLKLEQRLEALSRGITYMEWTFDPLEIKNAHLNLAKLGAIVRGYRENFYGVSSSRLQGGLPTDRLLAEWHMDSVRVRAMLAGEPQPEPVITETIVVPASIYHWKASDQDRGKALAVQSENRLKFQQAFARGSAILGFRRDAEGNGLYELGPISQSGTGI